MYLLKIRTIFYIALYTINFHVVAQYNPFGDLTTLRPCDNRKMKTNGSLIAGELSCVSMYVLLSDAIHPSVGERFDFTCAIVLCCSSATMHNIFTLIQTKNHDLTDWLTD